MGQAALQVQLHLNTPNSMAMAFRIQRDANEKAMLWKGAAFNAGIFGAKDAMEKKPWPSILDTMVVDKQNGNPPPPVFLRAVVDVCLLNGLSFERSFFRGITNRKKC